MVSWRTQLRYLASKAQYASSLALKNRIGGHVKENEVATFIFKHFCHGRMTFLHRNKGEEMAPAIAGKGAILLVRRLPIPDLRRLYIGDVVVLKNPEKPDDYLVRRLAATEGYEMASTDEKDESFVLEKDQCWVVAENEKLKAKEAIDSRTFGPIHITNIVGRVLYCLRSAGDHNRVQNSFVSMHYDSPVLEMELNVDEMAKSHKA
ncbi:putative peptidase S24/S26A/S26B/S26C, peptidase S24/S26, beta-ribbon domain-containing protein [Medicago truncatula]|uniref:Peptidase S24/S26A/S26B/S26C family protein n=1 Tax=Medicago truncatula TaxID=3880 RepID=A0A072VWP9_MEDTR|nr:uncharacterized protein LOC25484257 [Medicago truncatula]KEH42520.1 peptidase S24/S26A/S26B/S26C family protein [Medicago truncatula]RHN80028.1 putative peptidase S24/S26A/S26B/S26C, peptidase S24/S26, beta-ribbon domain-containing protein [Medicago truncatula]